MTVPLAVFGPGILIITQLGFGGPYTPVNIGYAQEFSYDEAGDTKQLFGQNQYPLVSARGTIKSTGKIKAATLSGIALAAAFSGQGYSSGQLIMQYGEADTVPGSPYALTVTPPGGGTYESDLGILYAATGLPFKKVSSAPAIGQYSESGGVYTFNASDSGAPILASYAYNTTGGQKQIVTNQPIGNSPFFQLDYSSVLNGQPYYVRFFRCIAAKLTRAHKLTDFVMPEIDFEFFANDAGQVYEVSYPQVA